jgi:hypothetical protein
MLKSQSVTNAAVLIALGLTCAACAANHDDTQTVATPTHLPRQRNGPSTSTNWSGYAIAAPAGTVTAVSGSWIVPPVVAPPSGTSTRHKKQATQYSSFWVGIDGDNSNSVEQIGTDSDWTPSGPVYYAWYEFYPQPSFNIPNFAVKPGDHISASVTFDVATSTFTTTITNNSTVPVTTFQKTYTPNGGLPQRSSAEWIVEAPAGGSILPLADFGTSLWGLDYTGLLNDGCSATIGGVNGTIASSFPGSTSEQITMVTNSGVTKALPSNLSSDGTSFSVMWEATGP